MPRTRSLLGGLVTTAAAGLTLAGCSAATSAGSVSATASVAASGTATAAAAGSGSGSLTIGGDSSYFPDTVGDTWVYQTQETAGKSTATNKVTGVASVAGGTQVTLTDTNDVSGTSQSTSLDYIVHSDGSVGVPISLGSDASNFKVKSGGLSWPSPAQLASGKPIDDTIVMSFAVAGTSYTATDHAVVKGEGTQSVTVPAGTYQATVIDDVETESVLGTPTTWEIKTYVVNGIGPIKDVTSTETAGVSEVASTEVLDSFTKG